MSFMRTHGDSLSYIMVTFYWNNYEKKFLWSIFIDS